MVELVVIGVMLILLLLLIVAVFYVGKNEEKAKQDRHVAKNLKKQRDVKRPPDVRTANVWLRKLRKK